MNKIKLTPIIILLGAFTLVEAVIYITFNVLSATLPDDPIYLKYAGVLLCLAMSVAYVFFLKDSDAVIVCCAFTATAVSDLFILVLDNYYQIGLITFIIAQSLYLYRLYKDRLEKIKYTLIVRAIAAGLVIAVFDIIAGLNFMLFEVGIYIVMLVGNVVDAYLLSRRGVKNLLFAIGLTLFLCCDICVGLDNAVDIIGIDLGSAGSTIQFLIWVFYLPSQVLIAYSVKKGGLLRTEVDSEEIRKTA